MGWVVVQGNIPNCPTGAAVTISRGPTTKVVSVERPDVGVVATLAAATVIEWSKDAYSLRVRSEPDNMWLDVESDDPRPPRPSTFATPAAATPAAATPAAATPSTIVRTYRGKQQADANRAFEADAAALARYGYVPTTQSWAQGQWGCGTFLFAALLVVFLVGILVFLYLLIVKPEGTLTVTYVRRDTAPVGVPPAPVATTVLAVQAPASTKVCPDCAETVQAAARICRFCRHEFWPADQVPPAT